MRAVLTFWIAFCALTFASSPSFGSEGTLEVVVALSSSVPESIIEGYGREARRFGARLVLRGIPIDPAILKERYFGLDPAAKVRQKQTVLEGWIRLASLAKRTGASLEIDPDFFRTHRIETVPRILVLERPLACASCRREGVSEAKPRVLFAPPAGAVTLAWVLEEALARTGSRAIRALLSQGAEP